LAPSLNDGASAISSNPKMLDLAAPLATALAAAAEARTLILAECARPGGPRGEIGSCPVDVEAELLIRHRLLAATPTFGYIGEETEPHAAADPEHSPIWIVDPNDGTSSMQRGYRGHAIAIGLVDSGRPVLGVVCAVDAPDDDGDLFVWAEGHGPLLRNGHPITNRAWPDTLQPHDVAALSQGANRNPIGWGAAISPARFVGLPSIAYRLALVAVGECAATVSLNRLGVWDYAAGHALIRGAGGVLVDESGDDITYSWSTRDRKTRVYAGSERLVQDLRTRPWDKAPSSGFGDAAPPPFMPIRPRVDALVHESGVLSRAQGCLLGQLAGDSLGALVEFQSADAIAHRFPDGGPRTLQDGGPHRIIAGQPTDDSELALLLARRLAADGDFNAEHVARAYAGWYHGWTHAEDPADCHHPWCKPFDVGSTTSQALSAASREDALTGHVAERLTRAASTTSQANGALMRVSPLGIWGTFRSPDEVTLAARADAALTHPHPITQDCSAVFALTLAASIKDGLSPNAALEFARTHAKENSIRETLDAAETHAPADYLTQQGWVLVALQNAFYQLLHAPDAESAVIQTVRSGGDTDTNAAICGALVGAVHGRDALPEQWRRMVVTARPMPYADNVHQPRPAIYWPIDALVLAERLLAH
jgi:ADP-ribosyl-[dinitrogen reductase] hydrolase